MSNRGISAREAGHKSELKGEVTLESVHMLSTYELRQELKKRGKFLDNFEGKINYEILLQSMVKCLKIENEERESNRIQTKYEKEQRDLKERLQMEKDRRKAEAIQRSLNRQKDRNYFSSKKTSNEAQQSVVENKSDQSHEITNEQTIRENMTNEKSDVESDQDISRKIERDNPFQLKGTLKIGGRYA